MTRLDTGSDLANFTATSRASHVLAPSDAGLLAIGARHAAQLLALAVKALKRALQRTGFAHLATGGGAGMAADVDDGALLLTALMDAALEAFAARPTALVRALQGHGARLAAVAQQFLGVAFQH